MVFHKPGPLGERVVEEPPRIRKRAIQSKEVLQATFIAATNGLLRHVVTAFPNSVPHSIDGQLRGRKPKEEEMKCVSLLLQLAKPRMKGPTCQRCLECEAGP